MAVLLGLVAFILLTVVTQIGGIALIIAWVLVKSFGGPASSPARGRWRLAAVFALTYAVITAVVVPGLAPFGGRVALSCGSGGNYAAAHSLYCILNRHYVDARLRSMLDALADAMNAAHPGTKTLYLDANFPFFDGFPLIPHLSHEDGRKLDLAFYYTDADGQYLPGAVRSPIGYFAFEQPPPGARQCPSRGGIGMRWDMDWLQPLLPDMKLDAERTRAAAAWLVNEGQAFGVEKLFLEPHLTRQLGLSSPLIRFQGCRAARHDDHIHVQIRR